MIGAIVGDIIGSVYEWNNVFDTDFPIPDPRGHVTDDSVMTTAVASALCKSCPKDFSKKELETFQSTLIKEFRLWYQRYPDVGYGERFLSWLKGSNGYRPYGSYGNGSAMRISPVSFVCQSEREVLLLADATTRITHDHVDALLGGKALALGTFLALHGNRKEEIQKRLSLYYPELSDVDLVLEKGKGKGFDFSCRGTVPLAIASFLKGRNEEEVFRLAVSLGGDSDTIASMAGALAEAFYFPDCLSSLEKSVLISVPKVMLERILDFHLCFKTRKAEDIGLYLKRAR